MMESRVINDDLLKITPDLGTESAQIVIADPPYNIGKDFGNNSDKQPMGDYLKWCDEWIKECLRILRKDGTMFIYGFSEILALILARIPEEVNRRWVVWHYTNKTTPSLNFWQRSHESIIVLWKDSKVFHRDDVREPYTDGFVKGAAGKTRKGTKGRFSKQSEPTGTPEQITTAEKAVHDQEQKMKNKKNCDASEIDILKNLKKEVDKLKGLAADTTYTAHPGGALPRDVIKIPALAGGAGKNERVDHPTQKPLELCEKLLKSCKQPPENGYVFVPFAGSGSECVAAKKLDLPYIGVEINKEYCDLIHNRISGIP